MQTYKKRCDCSLALSEHCVHLEDEALPSGREQGRIVAAGALASNGEAEGRVGGLHAVARVIRRARRPCIGLPRCKSETGQKLISHVLSAKRQAVCHSVWRMGGCGLLLRVLHPWRHWQRCAGAPVGGVTLNRVAGTSQRPCAPAFTRRILDVMYWMSTLSGDTSGPNCGSVLAALLRLPVCADPVTASLAQSVQHEPRRVEMKQIRRTAHGAPALLVGNGRTCSTVSQACSVPSEQHLTQTVLIGKRCS